MDEPTEEQMKTLREDIISGRVMIVEVEHYKRLTDNLDKSYDANKQQAKRIEELELAKTIGIQACDLLRERIKELEGYKESARDYLRSAGKRGKRIKELEEKLKWHKEEKLRLEKEVHALREREYCDDCSARTIFPEPHGIGCRAKNRIKELEVALKKFGVHKYNCAYPQGL